MGGYSQRIGQTGGLAVQDRNARITLKSLYPSIQRRCGRLIFKGLSVFLPPANLAFSLDLSGSA